MFRLFMACAGHGEVRELDRGRGSRIV